MLFHNRKCVVMTNRRSDPKTPSLWDYRWDDKVQICGSVDLKNVYILARGHLWIISAESPSQEWMLNTQKRYLPLLNRSEQIVLSQFTVLLHTWKTRKWRHKWAMQFHHRKTRSGLKGYEELFSYKRGSWAVITAVERSSSVCMCVCVLCLHMVGHQLCSAANTPAEQIFHRCRNRQTSQGWEMIWHSNPASILPYCLLHVICFTFSHPDFNV